MKNYEECKLNVDKLSIAYSEVLRLIRILDNSCNQLEAWLMERGYPLFDFRLSRYYCTWELEIFSTFLK